MASNKYLRLALPLLAVALAAVDSWSSRYSLNPMGISYLDMGDAFMRRDWLTAFNGLWSPLYSLPIGLLVHLAKPAPVNEFPLVHLVNFIIYLAALISLLFFLRELIQWQRKSGGEVAGSESAVLPEWALLTIGYAIFMWCSLGLIRMATTAPDLLVSVFAYLAFGILFRIRRGISGWPSFLLLGLVVGAGFLAKNPMLPLAPLFIFAALYFARERRKVGVQSAAVLLGLVLTVAPFIVGLSVSKHRLTFGDSGKLNYLWHVDRLPAFHWQGDSRYGTPTHPTRRIFENPSIYEFAKPLNATYPPWYDPSYWFEGAVVQFNLSQQLAAVRRNLATYRDVLFYHSNLALVAAFLLLLYIGRRNSASWLLRQWPLLAISLAACILYLPVHVEPRYIAPFITPAWLILFAALRFPSGVRSKRLIGYIAAIAVALIIFAQAMRSISAMRLARTAGSEKQFVQLHLAQALNESGVAPGSAVGAINFDPFWLAVVHWARLARVRIIAELPNTDSNAFLSVDESQRRAAIQAFANAGARAIIAERVPKDVVLQGWRRLGDTDYYLLKLNSP